MDKFGWGGRCDETLADWLTLGSQSVEPKEIMCESFLTTNKEAVHDAFGMISY